MGTTFNRLGLSELLPRYVFAEGLFARRRVLEIGAVATTRGESARFLLTRGARTVLATDADVAAVELAQKTVQAQGLRFRANVFDDLDSGSFDVLMIADLAPYVRAPEMLRELARLLARGGCLIGGLRNPAGLALATVMEPDDTEVPPTWGQLLDALSSHFPEVQVATQSPVLGYQLAFERGDGLQVDGSLAEATEAAYFVAIAGAEPVRAVDPTWVQLPPEPLAFTSGKLEQAAGRAREWQERTEKIKDVLERTRKDVAVKEGDLAEAREQLLGAREGVARLTVQLEEVAKRPQALQAQDELAARVRRLESELEVARERAQDAEGRVNASRAEAEAQARAQKDAAVEAIAAQEVARLERARREELVTQLEDTRTRLAASYQEHGKLQDELANGRVELERTRLQADRTVESLNVRERDLTTAKEREVRLAEARSEALAAVEVLERQLEETRTHGGDALAQLERKESERLAAMRSVEIEANARSRAEGDLARVLAELTQAQLFVQKAEAERPAFDTELQEAKAASHRLARDIEVLAGSDRTWRALAQELEGRLANTQANVEAVTEQLAAAESATEAEQARYRRLENDLSTAVGAERSAREQAEVALAKTQGQIEHLTAEAGTLAERRDALTATLSELENKRSAIAGQAGELEGRVEHLENLELQLTKQLFESRAALEAGQQQWEHERTRDAADARQRADELSQANARASALEQKQGQLEGAAAAAAARATEKEEQVSRLQARLGELKRESDQRAGELDSERDRLTARTQQRDELLEQLTAQKATSATLQEGLAEVQTLLAAAEAESQERQAKLHGLASRLEESEQRSQSTDVELKAQIVSLEERARQQAAEASEVHARIQSDSRALGQQLEDSSRKALGLVDELNALKTSRQALEVERDEKARAGAEATERAAQLTQQLETLRAETSAGRDELQAQLGRTRDEGLQLKQELEQARSQFESTRVAGAQLQTQLQTQRADFEARLRGVQGDLNHLQAELGESVDARLAEQGLREAAQLERDALRDRSAALEAELQRAKDEASKANEWAVGGQTENEKLTAAAAESKAELGRVLEELQALRGQHLDSSRELESATERLASTSTELSAARDQLDQSAQQRGSLEHAFAAAEQDHAKTRDEETARRIAHEQELAKVRDEVAAKQAVFDGELFRAREEAAARHARHEQAIADERTAAARALEARKADHARELEERETIAGRAAEETAGAMRRALEEAAATHRQQLEARDATHRSDRDLLTADATRAAAAAAEQLRLETDSFKGLLSALKDERDKWRGQVDRAQSEARGHQAGKAQVHKELEHLRAEAAAHRASLATAGGESKAMAEGRVRTEAELSALRERLHNADAELPKIQARRDELEAELARVRTAKEEFDAELHKATAAHREAEAALARAAEERQLVDEELVRARDRSQALELELSGLRGSAQGSTSDLESALKGRRQAEELLLALRSKYSELADQFQHVRSAASDVPRLKEELTEAKTEAQMLESERERLAIEIDRLERPQPSQPVSPGAADLAAQLVASQEAVVDRDARLEAMLRKLHEQQLELSVLKKAALRPPTAGVASVPRVAPAAAAARKPRPAASTVPPARPSAPPPDARPSAPPIVPGVEFEVFELDIDDAKGEELLDEMLILEEDEPLDPVKK